MGRLSSLPSALVTDDSALGGLVVERSLRFDDGDSAYLSRTPSSAGNRKTFTYSCWFKRGNIGIQSGAFLKAGSASSNYFKINIANDNKLYVLATIGGSYTEYLRSERLFRDTSAWMHLVLRWDTTNSTAADRVIVYINGSRISTSNYNAPTQDLDGFVNDTNLHEIGASTVNSQYWDGYIAEVNFIDGFSLDPSNFGYTDFQTKTWRPKGYFGSYGTNGFRLDFSDNSAATAVTLGKDRSGQGNDLTPSGLVASDSVLDTPSNNFATVKTLGTPAVATLSEGNLLLDTNNTGSARANRSTGMSTYFVNSGKWYCEHYHLAVHTMVGVAPPQIMRPYTSNNTRYVMVYSGGGNKYINTDGPESNSTYATNYSVGGTTGILLDMDQDTPVMYVSYNGQWANGSGAWNQSNPYTSGGAIPMGDSFFTNNIDSALSGTNSRKGYCGFWSAQAGGSEARHVYNFGQDSTFAGSTTAGGYKDSAGIGDFKYPVPDGALALCSNNLSRLDNERNTTSLIDPKKHFDIVTWSANSSTSNRKISGLEFQPDLVWTKTRNHTYHHIWFDSNRGPSNRLNCDQDYVENNTNGGYLASFDHDGFTWQYGGGSSNEWWNESGRNYVAWCWKAGGTAVANDDGDVTSQVSVNDEAGFSIVKWTTPASGSGYSIGHGLSKAPELIIMKNRGSSNNWDIYHHGNGDNPALRRLKINTNDAREGQPAWDNTTPTSTVFRSRTGGNWYNGNNNIIAYCWYAIPGYSAFGCYEGNGQSDGPYVYTGFRPAFLVIKSYSNSGASYTWFMCDSTRGPRNNIYQRLEPNTTNSEVTDSSNAANVDFYSDGFKLRGTGSMLNGNTVEYVYWSFAEQSTNTPFASEPNAR